MFAESESQRVMRESNAERHLLSIELGRAGDNPGSLAATILQAYDSAGPDKTLAALRALYIKNSVTPGRSGVVPEAVKLVVERVGKDQATDAQLSAFRDKVMEIGSTVRHDPYRHTAMAKFVEATFGQRYPDVWRRDQQNRGLAQKAFSAVRGLLPKKTPDVGLDPVTLEERTPNQP
jgi:hypothetical protein